MGNGVNRSLQKSSNNGLRKEWRPKSPSDMTLESGKQKQNVNTNIVIKTQQPTAVNNLESGRPILTIASSPVLMITKLVLAELNPGIQNTLGPSGVLQD